MLITEAKKSISDVVDSAIDYQKSINNLQRNIIELANETGECYNSIEKSISGNIVNGSAKKIETINKKLNDTLSKTKEALNKLSKDSTNKIKKLLMNIIIA